MSLSQEVTGVVRLGLARNRTDKVRMYAHREAHHVHSFYDVCGPVAAFLVRFNFVDHHVVLLVTVRVDVECREEYLSGVFHAGEEIDDFLFLLHYPILLLLAVGDAFSFEDAVPEAVGYLDVII